MIVVIFPVGAFGSTIEYSLRQFSNELTKIKAHVMQNGSIHSYSKEFHPITISQIKKLTDWSIEIATPIYPGLDFLSPLQTMIEFEKIIPDDKKVVVVHTNTLEMAERTQLFAYHKNNDFLHRVVKDKEKSWNSNYTSYNCMKKYELREALSYHIDQQKNHLEIGNHIIKDWLYISADDILYDFKATLYRIINYCGLTINSSNSIDTFYIEWFAKQQYILDEFKRINNIVEALDNKIYFEWSSLSILGEAIVQSRLRKNNMEIACFNLDTFPTNTTDLLKVIL
jgi:hypothetical protein